MTILNALKKLHKKMTGQDTNSKTIGGVLDSMQENYTGGGASGGGSLPEPGAVGNVLTSTGDGWESAAPQSGLPDTTGASIGDVVTLGSDGAEWAEPSDEYLITAEFNDQFRLSNFQHDGEAADNEEVLAAFNACKPVRLFATGAGNVAGTYATLDMTQNAGGTMAFGGVGIIAENAVPVWKIMSVLIVSFASPASMTVIDTLPDIGNGDTGKVLGVDSNNKYALVDGIPAYDTTADAGKVLTVTADGLAWVTPT